jgi:phosphoadenosine phosphosulfate reductase
LYVQVCC